MEIEMSLGSGAHHHHQHHHPPHAHALRSTTPSTATEETATNEDCWDAASLSEEANGYHLAWNPEMGVDSAHLGIYSEELEPSTSTTMETEEEEEDVREATEGARSLPSPHPPLNYPTGISLGHHHATHNGSNYHLGDYIMHATSTEQHMEVTSSRTTRQSSATALPPSNGSSRSPHPSYMDAPLMNNSCNDIPYNQAHHTTQNFATFRQDSQHPPHAHYGPHSTPSHQQPYHDGHGGESGYAQSHPGHGYTRQWNDIDDSSSSSPHTAPGSPHHPHKMGFHPHYQPHPSPHPTSMHPYNAPNNYSRYRPPNDVRRSPMPQTHPGPSYGSAPPTSGAIYNNHMASHMMQMTNHSQAPPYAYHQSPMPSHNSPQIPHNAQQMRQGYHTRFGGQGAGYSSNGQYRSASPSGSSSGPRSPMVQSSMSSYAHMHASGMESSLPDFESGKSSSPPPADAWHRCLLRGNTGIGGMQPLDFKGRLFVADSKAALNWNFICANRISIVYNCTTEVEDKFKAERVIYKRVPLDSSLNSDPAPHLQGCTEEMHGFLLSGSNVLVHCSTGRNRALCIATAYLIRYEGYTSLQSCIEFFRTQDILACLDEKARMALIDWQKSLFPTKPVNFFKPLSKPKQLAKLKREAKAVGKPRPIPKARKLGEPLLPSSKVEDIRRYLTLSPEFLHRNLTQLINISPEAYKEQLNPHSNWARLPSCYRDDTAPRQDLPSSDATTNPTTIDIASSSSSVKSEDASTAATPTTTISSAMRGGATVESISSATSSSFHNLQSSAIAVNDKHVEAAGGEVMMGFGASNFQVPVSFQTTTVV